MRILVTGSAGVVGQALARTAPSRPKDQILLHRRDDCDLLDFTAARAYMRDAKPDAVIHLAARVYGIMGNMNNKGVSYFENALINTHVVEAAREAGVRRFVAMGTGAVYPVFPDNAPLREEQIWLGPPHGSEDSYAHAKRAMLAQLSAYAEQYAFNSAFVVSCNLFGPHDRFNTDEGHVVPSLVAKFDKAARENSNISIWGDGSAVRDFLYADDAAAALWAILDSNLTGPINIGSGRHTSIREVVEALTLIHEFGPHRLQWNSNMPNGQAVRVYALGRLAATGFEAAFSLEAGLRATVDWYAAHRNQTRT